MFTIIFLLGAAVHGVYGLVGRTTMRNLSENHTGRAVQTVISSLTRDPDGFASLIRILTNAHFLVGSLYTSTCATWSMDDFKNVVKYSAMLHPLQRDRLLRQDCLSELPFQEEAYQILRDSGIPVNLPGFMKRLWDTTEWLKVLSIRSPEYISNWCMLIPRRLLTTEFLAQINLPYYMSPRCLGKTYSSKNLLVNALEEQIATRNHWSLLKLINNLRFIGSNLVPRTRAKLNQRICGNEGKGTFHLMNAKFLRCSWVQQISTETVLNCMRGKHLDGETLVMAVRMWIKSLRVRNTVSMLGKELNTQHILYSQDSIVLLQELSNEAVSRQKTFFSFLGLEIEHLAYYAPLSVWKERSEGQLRIHSMPLRWRLLYYRGWQMLPREHRAHRHRHRHEFKPLRYWSLHSFVEAKRRVDGYLAMKNYFNRQSDSVFPDPWVPEHVLEFVINTMIANIIQKGVEMLRFDATYCVSLKLQDVLRFSQSSLRNSSVSMSDSSSDEDLQDPTVCMEVHRKVFSKVYHDWKLVSVVEESNFCEFLSKNIDREMRNLVIFHSDPRADYFEEHGCTSQ